MTRHQPLTPQHVGSRRTGYWVPSSHISRALGDPDDVLREALKADNLRRFRQANPANDRDTIRARLNGPARHERIGEETLLDLFAGIAFWFLVGIAPALCVLAIIAVAK